MIDPVARACACVEPGPVTTTPGIPSFRHRYDPCGPRSKMQITASAVSSLITGALQPFSINYGTFKIRLLCPRSLTPPHPDGRVDFRVGNDLEIGILLLQRVADCRKGDIRCLTYGSISGDRIWPAKLSRRGAMAIICTVGSPRRAHDAVDRFRRVRRNRRSLIGLPDDR